MRSMVIVTGFISILCIVGACSKTKVVIDPLACMTLSATTVHVGDSIVVTNCSVADNVIVLFTDSTNADPDHCNCAFVGENFDATNKKIHFFYKTGANYVYLRVWNNQNAAPVRSKIQEVTVLP